MLQRRTVRVRLAGVALVALGAAGLCRAAPDSPATQTAVNDLAYGEVLFHFFQGDYFSALTRVLAAQQRSEFSGNAEDAEILLGGLYLSYGQHQAAAGIFERLLAQSVDAELHDRAWYFLARIWYQRGYLAEAEAALARITGALPAPLESQHQMLRAQVLMEQGRFDAALALLEAWREPQQDWVGYAKYNIGVALVRTDRVAAGAEVLAELGSQPAASEEAAALRDKANVALGYAWLQAGEPSAAKPPLQRVRLSGPFSNKALLGVGWADAAGDAYQAALVPWTELRGRSLADTAVQESLLAVPYAYAQLGASQQAASQYEAAISAFDTEIRALDDSIAAMRDGRTLDALLSAAATESSGWYWQLDQLPESAESRQLYELIATHRFQEALKNYRDLKQMQASLERGADSLAVFDDILDTRQRAYDERLPVVIDRLSSMDVEALNQRRVELESRLMTIEASEDVVALGTPREQSLWRDLTAVEADLALVGESPATADLAAKQRFLKGLLLWDLQRDYKARLWQAKRNLRDLDQQAKEAVRRYHQVDKARAEWPEKFASLTGRIDGLAPRIEALEQRLAQTLTKQQAYLQALAVDSLQARRDRLGTYAVQARFALASLYDRAAAQADARPLPLGGGAP